MQIPGNHPMIEAAAKAHGARGMARAAKRLDLKKSELGSFADRVNLSEKAKQLLNLVKVAKESPEARREVIGDIKEDIHDGKYGMKTVRTAEFLMKHAGDFYNSHSHLLKTR